MNKNHMLLVDTALKCDKFEVLDYWGKLNLFPKIEEIYKKIPSDTGLLCQYLWKYYDKLSKKTDFCDIINKYLSYKIYIFLDLVEIKDLIKTFETIITRRNMNSLLHFFKPEIFDKFGIDKNSERITGFLSYISISNYYSKMTSLRIFRLIEIISKQYCLPSIELQHQRLLSLIHKDLDLDLFHYMIENYDLNHKNYQLIESILEKIYEQNIEEKDIIEITDKINSRMKHQLKILLIDSSPDWIDEINWLSLKGIWGLDIIQSLSHYSDWNNCVSQLIFQSNGTYKKITLETIKILRKMGYVLKGNLKRELNLDVNLSVTRYLIKIDFFRFHIKDLILSETETGIEEYIKIKKYLSVKNIEIKNLIDLGEKIYKKMVNRGNYRQMVNHGNHCSQFLKYCIKNYTEELLNNDPKMSRDKILHLYNFNLWSLDYHIPIIEHLLKLGYCYCVNKLVGDFYFNKKFYPKLTPIIIEHIYKNGTNFRYISLWSLLIESQHIPIFESLKDLMLSYTPDYIWYLIENKLYHMVEFVITYIELLDHKEYICYPWIQYNKSKYDLNYNEYIDYEEYENKTRWWNIFNF